MGFHFHLGAGAAEGDLGGIGGVFSDEEIEDVDWLQIFDCGRWSGSFWRWVDDGDGVAIGIWSIFDEGVTGDAGGGAGDFDGFFGLFGGFLFVEGALVFLCFG